MDHPSLDAFKQTFSGEVVLPSDSQYSEAKKVLMRDGNPAIILRPRTAQDVVSSIQYAKESKLLLSVRSGGHSGAGFGTNDGGCVIDLSLINTVEILDKEKRSVRIGSGARWIDVANTLGEQGWAISSGDTQTVGVGGLTLGGGIGWLVRKVGLTIDSLESAEVVTADGRILPASATENSDLFWAIRGGGGNFGIVTYFEFTAVPLTEVFSGVLQFGLDDVSGILRGWRDIMRSASEELNTMALLMPSFGGNPPGLMILCCYAGADEAQAMQAIEPLEKLGKLLSKTITKKPYAKVLEEAHVPEGVEIITNNMFVQSFSDELIEVIALQCKTVVPIMQIRSIGGAMNRVASDATAFSHRDSEVLIVSPAFIPDGAPDSAREEALKPWSIFAKFGKGAYGNLLSTTAPEDTTNTYLPPTYETLSGIKKTYDPDNLFRQNYNITPKA